MESSALDRREKKSMVHFFRGGYDLIIRRLPFCFLNIKECEMLYLNYWGRLVQEGLLGMLKKTSNIQIESR